MRLILACTHDETRNNFIFTVTITFLTNILLLMTGCNREKYPAQVRAALEKAGNNRYALTAVLDHYRYSTNDSLKLQAAYYLIKNMPGHHYQQRPRIFNPIFDSAATIQSREKRISYFRRNMLQIKRRSSAKYRSNSVIRDIQQVTTSFLIKNIELAFFAYRQLPDSIQPDLQVFFKYILPYRASSEPLDFEQREKLYQKYQWAHQALQSGRSIQQVVDAVIDSIHIRNVPNTGYPGLFTFTQINELGFGTCGDMTNHLVNTLRAIGIPASIDFTPHWGNHYSMGHSWVVIHLKDSILALDTFSGERLDKIYKNASLPKVYRHTFEHRQNWVPFAKDVTTSYKPSNQITIAKRWGNQLPQGTQVYLMVFDPAEQWAVVDQARKVTSDSVSFTNLGPHIAYIAGYYDQSRNFHPINYPFIVENNSEITILNPHTGSVLDSAVITRKYPPFFVRNKKKRMWNRVTLTVEASHTPSFTSSHVLKTIHSDRSPYQQIIPLSYKGKYEYYRVHGPDTMNVWLAMLDLKSDSRPASITIFPENRKKRVENLTDGNPLTYSGGQEFMAQYKFTKPTKIHAIKFQPRNDGNHIKKGDRYELFYWEKGWKSAGIQVAEDTLLTYYNIPRNALYVLKNHIRGKEKTVFILTKDGKQWWPGASRFIKEKNP